MTQYEDSSNERDFEGRIIIYIMYSNLISIHILLTVRKPIAHAHMHHDYIDILGVKSRKLQANYLESSF